MPEIPTLRRLWQVLSQTGLQLDLVLPSSPHKAKHSTTDLEYFFIFNLPALRQRSPIPRNAKTKAQENSTYQSLNSIQDQRRAWKLHQD